MEIFRRTAGRVIAGVILGLIAVSFVFFGIDFSLSGATYAARVNGEEIAIQEFQRRLQQTQTQYLQLYQVELDDELRRQFRRSVVENMVQAEAMRQRVEDVGYRVSDARLGEYIRSIEAFMVGGEFSLDSYRAMIASQGMTVPGFEALQREELALEDLRSGIRASSIVTPAEFRSLIQIVNERRQVAYALFAVEDFTAGVEISDADIEAHYDENAALYMSEETVDLEYVELSLSDIADGIDVSEAELRRYYEENQDQFATQEERRVSHILIELSEGEREAAEAEADEIMQRLESGESFADLAAEYSDDAGTANQGGDLGWIGRDLLPGAYEIDEVGDIEGPVESDFGLHIIRLDDVREGDTVPFESVREDLLEQISTRRAEDTFYEDANRLADLAFDSFDELASVAMELGLPLEAVESFSRSGSGSSEFPNRAPVVQAAFDPENINTGTNTDIIELANDHVLVLRVTEHHPPEQLPLEDVVGEIRDELTRERATERAAEALDAYVEALEAGAERDAAAAEQGGEWHEPAWIRRNDGELPGQVVSVAFSLPKPSGSPVRERVMIPGGDEAVVFVDMVEPGDPDELPPDERERLRMQLIDQRAAAEFGAYVETVREQASVSIPDAVLNPQF